MKPFASRVDTDLVVRNLIYSVLYVSMILAFFSYLLWPLILKFKSQYVQERREKIIYTEIKKNYDTSVQRLDDFVINNSPSFTKLNNQKAFDEVQALVQEYLQVKTLKRIAESKQEDDQTRSVTYAFIAETKQVEKVWQLMDRLTSLQASVVIKPPVRIQRASMQSSTYEIAFSLEIRYSTYQTPPHLQTILAQSPSKHATNNHEKSAQKGEDKEKSKAKSASTDSSAESTQPQQSAQSSAQESSAHSGKSAESNPTR